MLKNPSVWLNYSNYQKKMGQHSCLRIQKTHCNYRKHPMATVAAKSCRTSMAYFCCSQRQAGLENCFLSLNQIIGKLFESFKLFFSIMLVIFVNQNFFDL